MKLIYFDSVLFGHSYFAHYFGIDCLFIVLFAKQVFIFPKIYSVYFTKHQRRRSSNRLILVRVTYLKFANITNLQYPNVRSNQLHQKRKQKESDNR